MISKRLSGPSCNREEFDRALPKYIDAMRKSGYREELEYNKPPQKKRNRKRNEVWFNPPFSESVKNNIGRQFLCLIDKHFPRHHRLHRICNRNTVEISYSCMSNMTPIYQAIIRSFSTVWRTHHLKSPHAKTEIKQTALNGGCRVRTSCYLQSFHRLGFPH